MGADVVCSRCFVSPCFPHPFVACYSHFPYTYPSGSLFYLACVSAKAGAGHDDMHVISLHVSIPTCLKFCIIWSAVFCVAPVTKHADFSGDTSLT